MEGKRVLSMLVRIGNINVFICHRGLLRELGCEYAPSRAGMSERKTWLTGRVNRGLALFAAEGMPEQSWMNLEEKAMVVGMLQNRSESKEQAKVVAVEME